MKEITQENLAEFKPADHDYGRWFRHLADTVGVESPEHVRDYTAALREWNDVSAIGFEERELEMISLMYSVAKNNTRYDNDPLIHSAHGGNTAEHPIFIGAAIDHFRKEAGFGPENFDPDSPETLYVAQVAQKVAAISAVHDAGELVDISYGEQQAVGASRKEPEEEALVAPFKFKLAAYALSIGEPDYYREVMADMAEKARAAKNEYFEMAERGEITGDEFVTKFGKVVGEVLREADAHIDDSKIAPEYQETAETLGGLYDAGVHDKSVVGNLFKMLDRYEGHKHYGYYAGMAAEQYGEMTYEPDSEKHMLNLMMDRDEQIMAVSLVDSGLLVDQVKFSHRYVPKAFAALEAEPEETRPIAEKLVRAVSAGIIREAIPLLQKAAPFIDIENDGKNDVEIDPADADRESAFVARVAAQREMKERALETLRTRRDSGVDCIEGVIDTKALIAVCDKAGDAIETGAFTPPTDGKEVFPIGTGEKLPEALQVSRRELMDSGKKHPLDIVEQFAGASYKGGSARI